MRRLLFFFKPSNKLFSSLDLNDSASRVIASTGLEFLRFLLDCANVSDHLTSRVALLNLMSVVNVCVSLSGRINALDQGVVDGYWFLPQ